MSATPPVIDSRDQSGLATKLREMLSSYAPEWPTPADVQNDPVAETFVQVFARLLKILIDRVNRVPEKNFLSFLQMLGFELTPARAARVPLRFIPRQGVEAGGRIPSGTQVAVEGTQNGIIFETREDMTLSLPALVSAYSYEPAGDRYTDHASIFDEGDPETASLFEGSTQVPHRIYFGHDTLFSFAGTARVQLDLTFKYDLDYSGGDWQVRWYQFDDRGERVEILPAAPGERVADLLGDGTVEFPIVNPIAPALLAGYAEKSAVERSWPVFARENRWIYAELDSSLAVGEFARAANIAPELMLASDQPINTTHPYLPFNQVPPASGDEFLIASTEVFGRIGSTVVINVNLDPLTPKPITDDVVLEYSYFDGTTWAFLGRTSESGVLDAGAYQFSDTTDAFKTSGAVRFFAPPAVARTEDVLESFWIRVQIVQGGYGAGETLFPPLVESILLEHSNVPELATCTARVLIDSTEPIKLDAAFLNLSEVDLSRDFFPFGERPKFNDTLYIASEEVFARAGALATISVVISPALTPVANGIKLLWEFFDGEDWLELGNTTDAGVPVAQGDYGFTDGTNAFQQDGQIGFTVPATAQTTVRAQQRTFLRVRIVNGNYGTAPNFSPPAFQSFLLNYGYEASATPAMTVVENNFFYRDVSSRLTGNAAPEAIVRYIEPFVAPVETDPMVLIGFDRSIASEPLSMFFPLVTRPFNAFLGAFNPDPPELAWEYWTGSQWSGVSINDRSNNLSRKEIVQVLTPGNAAARPFFGDDRFWLRLRLQSGSFALKPEVERLFTNVVWSDNQVTLREEALGSSNAQPSQEFKTSRSPVLVGQRIVVIEQALTEEDRALILAEEGADAIQEITDDTGDVVETRVRWHQVRQFDLSESRSRHYTLDSGSGTITFGDGSRGYIPPAGNNNVIAEEYRVGGGESGNVTEGVNEARSTFAFVEGVENPVPAEGGVDQETLEQIRVRGPAAIKHRNRAVTHEDYNAIVAEASGQIARVRTLQSTDSSFDFRPGHVTVIIVPTGTESKPFPSPELVESVEDYLSTRTSGFLLDALAPKVNVVGPGFVAVGVEADVAYRNLSEARQVERRVRDALDAFLHPLNGGPDGTGWEFGRNVYISEIYAVIEAVAGVDFVERATLTSSEQIFDLSLLSTITPQVPFLPGSRLDLRGQRTTADGVKGVAMTYHLVEKLREDLPVDLITAAAFKEGDFATLTTPAGLEPLPLLVLSASGALLEIDPTFAGPEYPAGSFLTIRDSSGQIRTRTTILEAVPAETEITGLLSAVPAAGDAFDLINLTSTDNVQSGTLAGVSSQVSVIELDQNFLVYPGRHLIRAAQNV